MFLNFTPHETLYLLSLSLVGEPALTTLATIFVALLGGFVLNNATPETPSPSPVNPGGSDSPTPTGGDSGGGGGGGWKKVLQGIAIGVATTVAVVAIAGYVGWNDPLIAFKKPAEFFIAGVDQLGRVLPGLTLTGDSARSFLETIYLETYRSVSNSAVIFPKIVEAGILPQHYLTVQTQIEELGLFSETLIQNVMSTYPQGASEATLRAALKITLNDKIDTIILEHANEWF